MSYGTASSTHMDLSANCARQIDRGCKTIIASAGGVGAEINAFWLFV